MRVVWQCEIDPFRRAVLQRHWPGVRCYEDIRDIQPARSRGGSTTRNGYAGEPSCGIRRQFAELSVDLICGGFPCQDLSVAGKRGGLQAKRSGLFFEFARIADLVLTDGGYVLIENVPGLFSSNGGRDFAVLLATLAEIGFHDLAWRMLDSRYFGVPQRRRRVYVLGRRARGRRSAEILLEPESGGGDFEKGGEAGPRVAVPLTKGSATGSGVSQPGRRQEDDFNLIAGPLTKRYGKGVNTTADDGAVVAHTLRSEGFDASEDGTGRGTPIIPNRVRTPASVPRRVDCAFDPKPDGPRYAACGDAVTVNVAEWLGKRIMKAER